MITRWCEWSYCPWCILCKLSRPASLLTKTCVHCHALGILSCPGYSQLLSPLGFLSWPSFSMFSRWRPLHPPPTPKHHSSFLKILVQFDALRKFLAASLVWTFVSFASLSCNHLLIWLTLHEKFGSRIFWRLRVGWFSHFIAMLLCLSWPHTHSACVCEASWWVDTTRLNGLIELWHTLNHSLS